MAILTRYFSSALWNLKKYREQALNLDVSEWTKDRILTDVEVAIYRLEELKKEYKYRR